MNKVTSRDGTTIAFDQMGEGETQDAPTCSGCGSP
jgi:hypothetical protein